MSKYSTPAATARLVEVRAKYSFADRPVVNMWWPHTLIESIAKASSENTIAVYPKNRLPEKTATTSATHPRNGKNMT